MGVCHCDGSSDARSIEHCFGVSRRQGSNQDKVEASQFVDEVLQDPRVHAAFMDKLKVTLDPECEAAW
jgi:hypothetical protein